MIIPMESLEELRAEESEILVKYRAYAVKLMAADPNLGRRHAMARAAEKMPAVTARYLYIVQRLTTAGVPAQPLR
jgi:hypothetical protein